MDFFSINRRPPTSPVSDAEDDDDGGYMHPAWRGAPDDVLPATVPMGPRILHQDPTSVLALTAINAYPNGAVLDVTLSLRRGARDRETWDAIHELAFGHRRSSRFGRSAGEDDGVKFGVLYPGGATATTLDAIDLQHAFGPDAVDPEPPVLQLNGSGGSGGNRSLVNRQSLWLWPLPPAETFTLIWAWPAVGINEGHADLDGKAVHEAALLCLPFWPPS